MGKATPATGLAATVCTALYAAQCVWAWVMLDDQHVGQYRATHVLPLAMIGVMLLLKGSKLVGKRLAHACGANKTNARKFGDQMWQLVIHVSMTAAELYVLMGETWYSDPPSSFAHHTRGISPPLKPEVHWLYTTQLSIWIITCFSHHFLEARHKDYVLMCALRSRDAAARSGRARVALAPARDGARPRRRPRRHRAPRSHPARVVRYVHHLVTIALILLSWSFGFQQMGTAVLYVHDASDITIDLLKMCNYLKLEVRARARVCGRVHASLGGGRRAHSRGQRAAPTAARPLPETSAAAVAAARGGARAPRTRCGLRPARAADAPRGYTVLLDGARSRSQGPSKLFALEIVFVLNLVSWAWWRVYQLPFRIVRACVMNGFVVYYDDLCRHRPLFVTCSCYAFVWLLFALCLMHVWWLYLLLRIAYKLIAAPGKGHDAGRDEYEGDSDDGSGKEN